MVGSVVTARNLVLLSIRGAKTRSTTDAKRSGSLTLLSHYLDYCLLYNFMIDFVCASKYSKERYHYHYINSLVKKCRRANPAHPPVKRIEPRRITSARLLLRRAGDNDTNSISNATSSAIVAATLLNLVAVVSHRRYRTNNACCWSYRLASYLILKG